jgi:cell pole-organizing protein PopZ
MSALNASAPSLAQPDDTRGAEPSMEDILASIRRIIADDDSFAGRRRREEPTFAAEPAFAPQAAYPAPALEPIAASEPDPAPTADIHQLRPHLVAAEPAEEAADAEAELDQALVAADSTEEEEPADAPLVSADAASSVASHFQALAASMIINDSGLLQKYAQEMLRPMLKQWLDDNLPVIVERLVRAEIERVARGGRR